jgi:hypothetical protein
LLGSDIDPHEFPGGLYPICWGLLKLLSKKGRPNHGRSLMLQLYQYTFQAPPEHMRANVPAVYYEWIYQKNTEMVEYDSRLEIAVTGIATPATRTIKGKGKRPQWPTDKEVGSRALFMDVTSALDLSVGGAGAGAGIGDLSRTGATIGAAIGSDEKSSDRLAEEESDPLYVCAA